MAIRINDFIAGMFAAVDIRLVDFKLEFGRLWDGDYARVILADEISPDGCRLWDMNSGEKLDKDRFRRDLGGEEEAYQEVARRLGVLQNDGNTPGEVFDLSAHRGRHKECVACRVQSKPPGLIAYTPRSGHLQVGDASFFDDARLRRDHVPRAPWPGRSDVPGRVHGARPVRRRRFSLRVRRRMGRHRLRRPALRERVLRARRLRGRRVRLRRDALGRGVRARRVLTHARVVLLPWIVRRRSLRL